MRKNTEAIQYISNVLEILLSNMRTYIAQIPLLADSIPVGISKTFPESMGIFFDNRSLEIRLDQMDLLGKPLVRYYGYEGEKEIPDIVERVLSTIVENPVETAKAIYKSVYMYILAWLNTDIHKKREDLLNDLVKIEETYYQVFGEPLQLTPEELERVEEMTEIIQLNYEIYYKKIPKILYMNETETLEKLMGLKMQGKHGNLEYAIKFSYGTGSITVYDEHGLKLTDLQIEIGVMSLSKPFRMADTEKMQQALIILSKIIDILASPNIVNKIKTMPADPKSLAELEKTLKTFIELSLS